MITYFFKGLLIFLIKKNVLSTPIIIYAYY